jgi:hypothetical protein
MEIQHYLVWRKNGGRKPSFKHLTFEAAAQEAERLVAETGAKFIVLAVLVEFAPTDFAEVEPA